MIYSLKVSLLQHCHSPKNKQESHVLDFTLDTDEVAFQTSYSKTSAMWQLMLTTEYLSVVF